MSDRQARTVPAGTVQAFLRMAVKASAREAQPSEPAVKFNLRASACVLDLLATLLAASGKKGSKRVSREQEALQRIASGASGQLSIISEHLLMAAGEAPEADRDWWPERFARPPARPEGAEK